MGGEEAKPRILVVDDEEPVRELFRAVLDRYEAEVVTAEDLPSAELELRSGGFALVITDLVMGGGGDEGMKVLRLTRDLHPKTPVVLITAYGTDDVLDKSFHRGAYCYLEKPLLLEDIFLTVEAVGIKRKAS